MPRPRSKHPTDGELEILRILWEHGPAPLGVVCEGLRATREVATTTVATMLKVMLDKRLVKRKSAAGRGYEWSAAVTRDAAATSMLGKVIDGVFDGSANRLVAHLVENDKLTSEELAELKKLVSGKDAASASKKTGPKKQRGGQS